MLQQLPTGGAGGVVDGEARGEEVPAALGHGEVVCGGGEGRKKYASPD